jgi:hypothetical protein
MMLLPNALFLSISLLTILVLPARSDKKIVGRYLPSNFSLCIVRSADRLVAK